MNRIERQFSLIGVGSKRTFLSVSAGLLAVVFGWTPAMAQGTSSAAAGSGGAVASRASAETPVKTPMHQPVPPAERLVGIAYTTWHRTTPWQGVWGKPELGFYLSTDRAVIRQHAEWLADAGVDFIWIDWSNDLDYIPGETKNRPDFDTIEGATQAIFEEYARLPRHPRISLFIGCPGAPEAVRDGRLTRKADQVYRQFAANPTAFCHGGLLE